MAETTFSFEPLAEDLMILALGRTPRTAAGLLALRKACAGWMQNNPAGGSCTNKFAAEVLVHALVKSDIASEWVRWTSTPAADRKKFKPGLPEVEVEPLPPTERERRYRAGVARRQAAAFERRQVKNKKAAALRAADAIKRAAMLDALLPLAVPEERAQPPVVATEGLAFG